MPKVIGTTLARAAAALFYSAASPAPAYCAWCYSAPCFGDDQCNAGCVCMSS